VNICPSLVEISSVTSEIRHRKLKEETTAVIYEPFGIVMPCGLIKRYCCLNNKVPKKNMTLKKTFCINSTICVLQ